MSFTVGDQKIQRGEKRRGYLQVAQASTHIVKLPYIVANGVKEGPTLTVLGGVHAVEYAPIESILRLADSVDPRDINGTLIMLPVVNTEGFHSRKPYDNQLDHLNQNKVFPGDPEGSITRRVAHSVFTHFVSRSTHLVDLHSADLEEDAIHGMLIYHTEDRQLKNMMLDMAKCFDCHFIETINIAGNTGEAIKSYGIPCIMTESGTPYPVREDDVLYHFNGTMNLMRHIGILEGDVVKRDPPVDPPIRKILAQHGGIWRRRVEAGQRIQANEVLGDISSLIGENLQVATSPFDGVISFLRTSLNVNQGDTLLIVTKI
jgi:predicted deacylase